MSGKDIDGSCGMERGNESFNFAVVNLNSEECGKEFDVIVKDSKKDIVLATKKFKLQSFGLL